MFIGHFAVGFAAKRAAPAVGLGALVAASQALDLIWPVLVLAGVEKVRIDPGNTAFTPLDFISYPWSHSLLMSMVWALIAGAVYFALRRSKRGALVISAAVFSHWVLDLLTHRPDLPLYPGSSTYAGLGLWNSVPATLIVEGLLFIAGVWIYASATKPRNRVGRFAFWAYVAFLALIYAGNATGSPPPSDKAVATVGLAIWLLVAWAAWVDRNRSIKPTSGKVDHL